MVDSMALAWGHTGHGADPCHFWDLEIPLICSKEIPFLTLHEWMRGSCKNASSVFKALGFFSWSWFQGLQWQLLLPNMQLLPQVSPASKCRVLGKDFNSCFLHCYTFFSLWNIISFWNLTQRFTQKTHMIEIGFFGHSLCLLFRGYFKNKCWNIYIDLKFPCTVDTGLLWVDLSWFMQILKMLTLLSSIWNVGSQL